MAYFYLYFEQIYIPKILIQTAMLWRRVSEIYKMCHKVPFFRLIRSKVILCNNTAFCDEGQTELLRDSPNFDGNVGID
jgi:hypothetical protein